MTTITLAMQQLTRNNNNVKNHMVLDGCKNFKRKNFHFCFKKIKPDTRPDTKHIIFIKAINDSFYLFLFFISVTQTGILIQYAMLQT